MSQNGSAISGEEVEVVKNYVDFTITCAAAGNYAALDVMSASATDGAGAATEVAIGGQGEIRRIVQVDARCSEDSVTFRGRLHFYNDAPLATEVEMDDNAAFDGAKTAAGEAKYLTSLTMEAFRDEGTAMAVSNTSQLVKYIACADDDHRVYAVLQTLDAETNETASMTIDIRLYFD